MINAVTGLLLFAAAATKSGAPEWHAAEIRYKKQLFTDVMRYSLELQP